MYEIWFSEKAKVNILRYNGINYPFIYGFNLGDLVHRCLVGNDSLNGFVPVPDSEI